MPTATQILAGLNHTAYARRAFAKAWHTAIGALLVPPRGEVGWHVDGQLEIVWKCQITSFDYELNQG